MSNSEWKNLLSETFGISKSEARQIYHIMLANVKYFHWLHAFRCRMAYKNFDYHIPIGKCIECKNKKYCLPQYVYKLDN